MVAGIIKHAVFFLLLGLCISGTSIAEKQSPEAIKESKKLNYHKNQAPFSSLKAKIQIDNTPLEIPVVHQTTSGGAWCIASPTASETAIQVALDYACGYGGADCSAIQPNGACYDPNTVRDHASFAFNNYYQRNPTPTSCVFGGTAQLSYTDPSHGNCRFASATSIPTTPPVVPTTPPSPMLPITPPSTTTPVIPNTPGGGNGGFGLEPPGSDYSFGPTGTPSQAAGILVNILLLIAMNCVISLLAAASYF